MTTRLGSPGKVMPAGALTSPTWMDSLTLSSVTSISMNSGRSFGRQRTLMVWETMASVPPSVLTPWASPMARTGMAAVIGEFGSISMMSIWRNFWVIGWRWNSLMRESIFLPSTSRLMREAALPLARMRSRKASCFTATLWLPDLP